MSRFAKQKIAIRRPRAKRFSRPGIVTVLSALLMVVCFAFVSFAVDTGLIVLTKSQMQNAVDAAALAASQEIVSAVHTAGQNGSAAGATQAAVAAARTVASEVAQANGVYVDPAADVTFGNRAYNNGSWAITWGKSPYNTVKVTARRESSNLSASDGRLKLAFGWAVNTPSVPLRASASSFVEARDMVLVQDYSGSMNDDSTFFAFTKLGKAAVEANMLDIFNIIAPNVGTLPATPAWPRFKGVAPSSGSMPQIYVTFQNTKVFVETSKTLQTVKLEFSNGATQSFTGLSGTTGTYQGSGSNNGKTITKCWVKSANNSTNGELFDDSNNTLVKKAYGLDAISYPYSSGGSWDEFINYCRTDSQVNTAGYKLKYGKLNFINYLHTTRPHFNETNVLWKTPAYPFTAVKDGATQFTQFLADLSFDDELGLVTYDDSARIETTLNMTGASVNIASDPITSDYSKIDTIQTHKQASHYGTYTATGDGIAKARTLLNASARGGAKKVLIVMTDGLANRAPSGWSLPSGFSWSKFTDYDGNGSANYTTNDVNVQYAFYQATQAIAEGATIHTISVGADGDDNLLSAIAFAGGGVFVDVPGGSTIAAMQDQMNAAFAKIAAKLPPPKLVYDQ